MAQPASDKASRRHRREKGTIDHLVKEVYEEKGPDGELQSPTTDSGLPVEEQIRKEWDPKKGGLPTF